MALELECLAIVFMCSREVHIYLWLKNSGRKRSQTIRDQCKKVSFVYSQMAAKNATPATETQFRNCVSSQFSTVDSRYVVTVTSKNMIPTGKATLQEVFQMEQANIVSLEMNRIEGGS